MREKTTDGKGTTLVVPLQSAEHRALAPEVPAIPPATHEQDLPRQPFATAGKSQAPPQSQSKSSPQYMSTDPPDSREKEANSSTAWSRKPRQCRKELQSR